MNDLKKPKNSKLTCLAILYTGCPGQIFKVLKYEKKNCNKMHLCFICRHAQKVSHDALLHKASLLLNLCFYRGVHTYYTRVIDLVKKKYNIKHSLNPLTFYILGTSLNKHIFRMEQWKKQLSYVFQCCYIFSYKFSLYMNYCL